jgi:hypothetical protein
VGRSRRRRWKTRRGTRTTPWHDRLRSHSPKRRPNTVGDRAGPRYAAEERSDILKSRIRGARYDDRLEERSRRPGPPTRCSNETPRAARSA